jgi:hypothetical protein
VAQQRLGNWVLDQCKVSRARNASPATSRKDTYAGGGQRELVAQRGREPGVERMPRYPNLLEALSHGSRSERVSFTSSPRSSGRDVVVIVAPFRVVRMVGLGQAHTVLGQVLVTPSHTTAPACQAESPSRGSTTCR